MLNRNFRSESEAGLKITKNIFRMVFFSFLGKREHVGRSSRIAFAARSVDLIGRL
jgi:hypothetical protein